MRKPSSVLALLTLAACEHPAAAMPGTAPADAAPTVGAEGSAPVLVELYTSQGCSSCPPADELLTELVADPQVPIIPLAFHVDYWDALGWPDPFADARWTRRQRQHAAITGSSSIYTPQLLFDGRDHRVGTRAKSARAAVRAQSRRPPAVGFELAVEQADDTLRIHPNPRWREDVAREPVSVMVALTDSGHHTDVRAGENLGRTLEGNFVVREMAVACTLTAEDDQPECSATLSLASLDVPKTARVVAFAQGADRRIHGVATIDP